MNRRRIFALLLGAALFAGSACSYPGTVRATHVPATDTGKIAIGFFENRQGAYSSFPVKNFVDSLEFAFMSAGYEVLDYHPALLEKTRAEPEAPPVPSGEKGEPATRSTDEREDALLSRSDGTDELFPEKMRSIAGESGARRRGKSGAPADRYLTPEEIGKLAGVLPFDYFLQGSAGTTSRAFFGSDFDEEEDSLIFIKVYNRKGRRIGALRFLVDRHDYSRASFLADIARRIVAEFPAAVREDSEAGPEHLQEPVRNPE